MHWNAVHNINNKKEVNMNYRDLLENQYDLEYGRVDESGAGISRVLKTLDSGVDFLIITAFRGTSSKKENTQNNNKLIKYIRSEYGTKIGAYKLVGHWKECSEPLKDNEKISDCKGQITDTLEESWLIVKPDDFNSEDFLKIAIKSATKYNQDAFIIRKDGKLTINGKDGTVWEDLGKANKKSLSQGFSKIVDVQGFSELKKNRGKGRSANIVFESLNIVIPKEQNSSKELFTRANILY
jgi:hypothetical protein